MRIRSALLLAALFSLPACGGGGAGKIMADTTILPYQAPDVDEIAGTDSDDEETTETPPATGTNAGSAAGAGSAQNPQK